MNTYDVILGDAKLGDAVMRTQIPGLDVVPSLLDLSAAEVELVERPRREYRLKEALAGADKDYDYVLIDCPPSLGLLTVNALVAAKSILVPLQCEFFALEGLSLLLRTVDRVRRTFNPDLEVQGVLLKTMFDRRNNLAQQVATTCAASGARLRHGYSAQRARVRGAVPWHARVAVRFRCPGAQACATRQRRGASRPRERPHERTGCRAARRAQARAGHGAVGVAGNARTVRTPKASTWSRSNSCGRRPCSRGVISAKTNWRALNRIDPRQGRHAAPTGPPAARW